MQQVGRLFGERRLGRLRDRLMLHETTCTMRRNHWAVQRRVWDGFRNNNRKGFVDTLCEVSLSYYFTNLPDDASRSDLWKVFALVGDVLDVFIPSKVDKLGWRFGFVHFQNKRDVAKLERRLDRSWMGSYKLQINRSHQPKPDNGVKKNQVVETHVEVLEEDNPVMVEPDNYLRWGEWPRVGAWQRKPIGGNHKALNMEYVVDDERVKLMKSCYGGILAESHSATALEFQHSLLTEGYHAIMVTPMGGDSVLLSSNVEGAIVDAINSNGSWWLTWLRGFSVWDPSLISTRRRVWLRYLGVPLHVWEEKFFNSLAVRFGKCEEVDGDTKLGQRYDVGRVRVLTSYSETIDQIVNLDVGGEVFPVKVIEERFGNVDGGMNLPP